MAYTITDRCVACGSCAEQCPVEAISEGDGKYEISAPPTLSRKANLSQTRIGLRKCLRRPIFCCIIA